MSLAPSGNPTWLPLKPRDHLWFTWWIFWPSMCDCWRVTRNRNSSNIPCVYIYNIYIYIYLSHQCSFYFHSTTTNIDELMCFCCFSHECSISTTPKEKEPFLPWSVSKNVHLPTRQRQVSQVLAANEHLLIGVQFILQRDVETTHLPLGGERGLDVWGWDII